MINIRGFKFGDKVKLNCDYCGFETGAEFTVIKVEGLRLRVMRSNVLFEGYSYIFDKITKGHSQTNVFK